MTGGSFVATYASEKNIKIPKKELEFSFILSLGTCLEMFDRFLYLHMGMFLEKLFFPNSISGNWILSNIALGATFFFSPIGGVFFGWLGDKVGRTSVIFITTFFTALTCIVMTILPTYSVIGLYATYILTLCRVLQGIVANSEFYGAHIYITENVTNLKNRCTLGIILCIGSQVGGKFLAAGAVATSLFFVEHGITHAWRGAFLIGAFVATIGVYARRILKETPEFIHAKTAVSKLKNNIDILQKHPSQSKPSILSCFYYTIFTAGNILFGLFPFTYCKDILVNLGYSSAQISMQSLYVGVVMVLNMVVHIFIMRVFCVFKFVKYRTYVALVVLCLVPWLVASAKTRIDVFILQVLVLTFGVSSYPASPIIYTQFPVLHRAKCIFIPNAFSGAISFLFLNCSMPFLSKYFGNYTFLTLATPISILGIFAIKYFEKQHYKV